MFTATLVTPSIPLATPLGLAQVTELLEHSLSPGHILSHLKSPSFGATFPGIEELAECTDEHGRNMLQHSAEVVSRINFLKKNPHSWWPHVPTDGIDTLAALLIHLEKPACRKEQGHGTVTFTGYAEKVAGRVQEFSKTLGLDRVQTDKLRFLLLEHVRAATLGLQPPFVQHRICASPYWQNLQMLSYADFDARTSDGAFFCTTSDPNTHIFDEIARQDGCLQEYVSKCAWLSVDALRSMVHESVAPSTLDRKRAEHGLEYFAQAVNAFADARERSFGMNSLRPALREPAFEITRLLVTENTSGHLNELLRNIFYGMDIAIMLLDPAQRAELPKPYFRF